MVRIPKCLSKFLSNIYIHNKPLFILYKPKLLKLKGFEIRQLLDNLEPGDILLRRTYGYLGSMFIPGFWSHSGLYVGNNNIIHAVGSGVIEEDILDFCRTDSMSILRIKDPTLTTSHMLDMYISTAKYFVAQGVEYDYEMEPDDDQLYCTELVNTALCGLLDDDFNSTLHLKYITPDAIYNSNKLKLVIEFKH